MCLAIPGQVIEFVDEANRLARVEVAGVRRNVNVGLLDDDGRRRAARRLGAHPRRLRALEGRRGGGARHARAAAGHGRGLRAGARGAQGERDRVSEALPACTACVDEHCITCGDEGLRCASSRRRRARPRALSRRGAPASPTRRSTSQLVGAGRAPAIACSSTRASRSRASAEATRHEVRRRVPRRRARAARWPREILSHGRAGPPLQGHGGLRRAHALDLQVRRRRPAAGQRRARARPRLPGLRDPDGPRRRRHRRRPRARA